MKAGGGGGLIKKVMGVATSAAYKKSERGDAEQGDAKGSPILFTRHHSHRDIRGSVTQAPNA